jgi:hypothetical protein
MFGASYTIPEMWLSGPGAEQAAPARSREEVPVDASAARALSAIAAMTSLAPVRGVGRSSRVRMRGIGCSSRAMTLRMFEAPRSMPR